MDIKVVCPACKKQLKAPETMAGKKVQCPACKAQMRLPELPPKAAAAATSNSPRPATARTTAAPQTRPASRPAGQPGQTARPATAPAPAQPASNMSSLFDEEDEYKLAAPPKPASGLATRPCPTCGESIPFNAPKCQYCGLILDPVLKQMEKQREEKKRKRSSYSGSYDEDLSAFDWVLAILCTNIGIIVGIVWLVTGNSKGKKMLMVCGIVYAVGFVLGFVINMLAAVNQGSLGQ
jgi:hypothetical protein